MSFWSALAVIESDGNDYAVGSVGEISRYQIRPEVWHAYSSSRRYSNPSVALPIAEKYMAKLKRDFERATGRDATEADCVILWKAGIAGYEKRGFKPARMSAAHQDRINRFQNLRAEEFTSIRAPSPKPLTSAPVSSPTKPTDDNVMEKFFAQRASNNNGATNIFGDYSPTNQPAIGAWFARNEAAPETRETLTPSLQ